MQALPEPRASGGLAQQDCGRDCKRLIQESLLSCLHSCLLQQWMKPYQGQLTPTVLSLFESVAPGMVSSTAAANSCVSVSMFVGTRAKQRGEDWGGGSTCCSKGAMPGTNSMAVNSIVPSTLKWECARGSKNSLKVCLKKASYSSLPTCVDKSMCRLQSELLRGPRDKRDEYMLLRSNISTSKPCCMQTIQRGHCIHSICKNYSIYAGNSAGLLHTCNSPESIQSTARRNNRDSWFDPYSREVQRRTKAREFRAGQSMTKQGKA